MAIDRDTLLNWQFPDVVQEYGPRDTMLYGLGLGIGADPTDPAQLRFVYEDGLRALPSMAVVLGYPGFWLRDPKTGVDWRKLLHGEQGVQIFRPLPASGKVVGKTRVTEILDKGAVRGALMYSERDVVDHPSGELLCRTTSTTFMRGDGGFGGPAGPAPAPHPIPDRAPDREIAWPTLPQAALIYRLSGDYNPLHADPEVARGAGFERPILHGLCTYGITCRAVLQTITGWDPDQIASHQARFSAPVFPGDTISVDLWQDGKAISFEARVASRNATVIKNGLTMLR